jgi:hypothetical protein
LHFRSSQIVKEPFRRGVLGGAGAVEPSSIRRAARGIPHPVEAASVRDEELLQIAESEVPVGQCGLRSAWLVNHALSWNPGDSPPPGLRRTRLENSLDEHLEAIEDDIPIQSLLARIAESGEECRISILDRSRRQILDLVVHGLQKSAVQVQKSLRFCSSSAHDILLDADSQNRKFGVCRLDVLEQEDPIPCTDQRESHFSGVSLSRDPEQEVISFSPTRYE